VIAAPGIMLGSMPIAPWEGVLEAQETVASLT
jgi:hypothetical protein